MEPLRPRSAGPSEEPARDDLRGLRRLRERIEAAARELERLREENAALTARVAALEGNDPGAALALDVTSPEAAAELRARIDGFIAAIDQALREGDGSMKEALSEGAAGPSAAEPA